MALLGDFVTGKFVVDKSVRTASRRNIVQWCAEAASASVSTIGLSLGLSLSLLLLPASAAETDSQDYLNSRPHQNLTRLQTLQLGARRVQLDRVLRSPVSPTPALGSEIDTDPVSDSVPNPTIEAVSAHNFSTYSFSAGNGTYLYGQYPVYDQPAAAYFVFERKAELIEGAFYTPSSSFDCARGRVDSEGIQLTITNSYSQESYSYALDVEPATTQTASGRDISLPQRISGYYALPVRAHDRDILANCQVQ